MSVAATGSSRRSRRLSGPATGGAQAWKLIGSSTESAPDLPGPRLSSHLTVSGDYISNVMFDRKLESAYAEPVRSERTRT